MQLAYFVYDLNDPAVRRRVSMFHAAGVRVQLIGFHRHKAPPSAIDGAPVFDLGETFDGRLGHRTLSVVKTLLRAGPLVELCRSVDLIMARNLEMLAIATRVRSALAGRPRLVYECLDVHRSLLSDGAPSKVLRGLERWLTRGVSTLVVSSPAFARCYFEARQNVRLPTLLVENKVLDLVEPPAPRPRLERAPGPVWRIGWFGMIRCRRSLRILIAFTEAMDGRVEVVIRGRPAYTEFEDFDAQVASAPHVRFEGPYQPEDLRAHYGEVHFTWAIDYFEEGLNSAWLLPNRLYEGDWFGAVPLALAEVETGAWLKAYGAGVLLTDPETELKPLFDALTAAEYARLGASVHAIPDDALRTDPAACRDLVASLTREAA